MTAITTAARLLRVAADELKNAHTLGGDWGNEHEALDAYNEHMATATTLEHMARQCLQQIEEPAGAAPASVAPQGEYPEINADDFAAGSPLWGVLGLWAEAEDNALEMAALVDEHIQKMMRAYVDTDRAARAEQPAAVAGPSDDCFWPIDMKASRKQLIAQIGRMNFRIGTLRQENAALLRKVRGQTEALHNYQKAADAQEPLFWYRPCRDGLYEGPHHNNSNMGKMLRAEKPGEWKPLFANPALQQAAPQAPAAPDGESETMQALSDLTNALRERHYGRMPEEVQRAYDKAWTIVFAGPRAQAAPAAPAVDARDAEIAKLTKACAELSSMFHDQIVAQQAAWIEWQHGGGAEAGMQWIENGLDGPGHIPDEDEPYGKEAQAWFDANKSDPFPACPCGRPSNILWMGHGFCCNAHHDEFRAAQAAAKEGGAA